MDAYLSRATAEYLVEQCAAIQDAATKMGETFQARDITSARNYTETIAMALKRIEHALT